MATESVKNICHQAAVQVENDVNFSVSRVIKYLNHSDAFARVADLIARIISVTNGTVAVIKTTFHTDLADLNVKKYIKIIDTIVHIKIGVDRVHLSLIESVIHNIFQKKNHELSHAQARLQVNNHLIE